ncbi:flagellar basal-body MS-ring/collar protein FliF [Methylobrevis albus]|nr:flagellar basal-body MS-ring/collar protein FliF [Methylobrevis albus]
MAVLKSLGAARLGAMGAVALGLVAFFAFMIMRFNEVQMAPLYNQLSFEDSSSIVSALEAQQVPYEMRNEGATILVPADRVLRLRMSLAEEGLPLGGSVGYEIFDKTDALGTTSFVQNVNHLRALEGELARTIRAIGRVEAARVHLVLPTRQLFRREAEVPTASIVLRTRGTLEPSQIRAIQHLVASAVEGLDPSRISIVDEAGRLLAAGGDANAESMFASSMQERTEQYQDRLEAKIEEIVSSIVGPGRARARVSATLDFNRVTETRDLFDPEGQVVRSTQTREEQSSSSEPQGEMTVGNQVPNGGAGGEDAAGGPREAATTSEETVNYEISKTTRTEVVEAGGVKRLSVAVLIDGYYLPDAQGVPTYSPRDQAELDRIAALVRTAMGYDQSRGDQIEIVNLRFAEGPQLLGSDGGEPGLFEFDRADIMRFAELGVMAVLTLLVLLFAVRPLIKRILSPEVITEHRTISGATVQVDESGNPIAVAQIGPDGNPVMVQIEGPPVPSRIEEAQAQGEAQMVQVRKVGELVVENPGEASIIVRTWLSEAA